MHTQLEEELLKASVGLLVAFLVWVFREVLGKRIMAFFATYQNIKKGAALMASPGFQNLPEVVRTNSIRLASLEFSIKPNGGGSISDGINRIEKSILSVLQSQNVLANQTGVATWRSNENGECVWASQALCDMVGWSFEDGFQGGNWTNIYFDEDIPLIEEKWADAVKTKRALSIPIRYKHRDGHGIPVHVRAIPLADGTFMGTATRVSA